MGNRGMGFYWKLAFTNIQKNRRVYLPYLLSSAGIILMFYTISALVPGIDQSAMYGGSSVTSMLNLGQFVIGLFAVLFLFYTNSFIIKRRKKELGLYNILGMEKLHIAKILFRETLIIACVSLVLGMGLGVLFSRAMFWLLGVVLGSSLPITFVIPLSSMVSTLVLFGIIFLLTLLYNLLQVRLSKPIELLHGGEKGEKEPKAHWILAILGALFLGAGYYMAVTITSPLDALIFFFVAVLLVILGTYLLFITGITALLKLLKKNKNFYYKTNHFTAVSGMLFRMKQNAAGLASICVLFTALLVTVSTTFSLYRSMDDLLRTRYPRNILISAQNANQAAKDLIRSTVKQEVDSLGLLVENVIDRTCWNVTMARNGNSFSSQPDFSTTYAVAQVFTQEEFEYFSCQTVDLSENQVILFDPFGTFPQSSEVMFDGKEYSVVSIDYDFPYDSTSSQVYETYYMVVKDETIANTIFAGGTTPDPESFIAPTYSYNFDIAGEDSQDILAISNALRNQTIEGKGVQYDWLMMEDCSTSRGEFLTLYGGLFFLGMFLGVLFLLGTALIIYYKQVSEGYEDARRFSIMQKVGMSHKEVKQSIHSQILLVFFLPLLTAVIHLAFAFPMLQKILLIMGLSNFHLILYSTIGCVAVFALAYLGIYAITARTYYNIVESASE